MNSGYEKRHSLEELMGMNSQMEFPKTVQMTEDEWNRLSGLIQKLEQLTRAEATERKQLTAAGEKYLTAIQKAVEEQTNSAKRAMEQITELAEEQVGKASERASRVIENHSMRDEFLWWLRLLFMALPTVLVLALSVYMGWLPLFR